MDNNQRTKEYQKDGQSEDVLAKMNQGLLPLEQELIESFGEPKHPVIFIVGAQRSGTTLLMQMITQQFHLAYPSNFIARYWMCPFIGATLYQSLQLGEEGTPDLTSDLGFTKGINGPHEFGYFWKRWFPWEPGDEFAYRSINYDHLSKEISAWQSVEGKPIIFKNLIQIASHIEKLHDVFPNAYFLNLERSPLYNMQSTYLSRKKLFGDINGWFGVKPKAYPELQGKGSEEQIAGQVYFVRKEIRDQLSRIPNNRQLNLSYEELVASPQKVLEKIQETLPGLKRNVDTDNSLPQKLSGGNTDRLPAETLQKLQRFYHVFEDNDAK